LESTRPPGGDAPANRWLPAVLLGLGLAGAVVALGRWTARSLSGGRTLGVRILGMAIAGWSLVAGLLGWILVLAWAFTDHDFWRWNENLFQTSPLLIAGPVLAIPMIRAGTPGTAMRRLLRWVAALALAGVLLKVLPWLGQQNWEVVAVTLPVNLALAWVVDRLAGESV
jgi:MFS family permease